MLDKLIRVAEQTGEASTVEALKASKTDRRFSAAVDDAMPAVPSHLMIKTHNPLKLLHEAFSDGVHNLDDAACLERATDGRRVLEQLLHRVEEVLHDDEELKKAVARLTAKKAKT